MQKGKIHSRPILYFPNIYLLNIFSTIRYHVFSDKIESDECANMNRDAFRNFHIIRADFITS